MVLGPTTQLLLLWGLPLAASWSPQAANSLSTYGGSMLHRAEDLYEEKGPSRAVLQSVLWRVWTGAAPSDDPEVIAQDPARGLPEHGVEGFEPVHDHSKKKVHLFEEEDMMPWIVFTMVFFVLVIFDNWVLHRKAEKINLVTAILYTTFWIAVAGMFNLYVYYTRGMDDAFSWGTGYLLEWMLSVDNLFVFHRIFKVFKTPDEQKHKPLFYGIVGAIVFRMIFFLIEEMLLHHVTWMHLVFGLFLIYTGVMAVWMDEEDGDGSPEKGTLFNWCVKHIDYVDEYDPQGRFFVLVDVNKDTNSYVEDKEDSSLKDGQVVKKWKATRLVLVVVCLEVTDLVFAVDSVSAIVAQIPDLFLAYTACVFAMLGLRAMFFAIDELVKMFSLLCYGVAFILIFLGFKLIMRSWIHIPPKYVMCILFGTIALSIVASLLIGDDPKQQEDDVDDPEDTASARSRGTSVRGA